MKKARAMYIPAGGKTAVWGPVDHNVLPEGYPYKEQSENVVFEDNDLSFEYDSEGGFGYWHADEETPDSLIAADEKYTVIFDGVTYPDVVASDPEGMGGLVAMGAISEEYDYPFVISASESDGYWTFSIEVMSDAATHSVTILGTTEIIHPIAPEFLPEGVGGGSALIFNVSLEPNQRGGYNGTPTVPYDEVLSAVNAGLIVVCKMIRTDDADNDVAVLYCQGTDGWGNIIFWGFENYQNRSGRYFVQAKYLPGGSFSADAPNTYFQIEPDTINLNDTGLNVSGTARFGANSLKIEGADGAYYTISVGESGNLVATK